MLLRSHPHRMAPCRAPLLVGCLLLVLVVFHTAHASDKELWWQDAELAARQGHYGLVDIDEMRQLLNSDERPLMVDTRTDYEYRRGHIPWSRHLEFSVGDSFMLPEDKKKKLLDLLGPDKERVVIFYCRSFR